MVPGRFRPETARAIVWGFPGSLLTGAGASSHAPAPIPTRVVGMPSIGPDQSPGVYGTPSPVWRMLRDAKGDALLCFGAAAPEIWRKQDASRTQPTRLGLHPRSGAQEDVTCRQCMV